MNENIQNPVAVIVSRLVERDDVERARLVIEIERSRASGGAGWQDDEEVRDDGTNWRRFWINFATEHPLTTAFAPFSAVCYAVVIYQMIFGG